MNRRISYLIVAAVVGLIVVGGMYVFQAQSGPTCSQPLGPSKVLKSQLSALTFGAVTEFKLPMPSRNPNGLAVAQDGSVWFGEQTTPGVGHLFPNNGTLVEYAWPFTYPEITATGPGCVPRTEMWGLALWNGEVWASDPSGNQLVGLNPVSDTFRTVKLPTNNSFPYSLAVDPTNSLWFTELFTSKIGKVDRNLTLHEYTLPEGNQSVPSEIKFVSSTLGYYSDAGESGVGNGGVYSFNPGSFSPVKVSGNQKLNLPTSLAPGNGGIWLALHGSSEVSFYNLTQKTWATYPTSTVSYAGTTLPYFIKTNDSSVWFNEHYGNKIAMIDPAKGLLTEYSVSNPPPTSGSDIDNILTFALGQGKAWFAGWTANYIGFVDASYRPGYSISTDSRALSFSAGETKSITVRLSGQSSSPLSIKFSDSEGLTGSPKNIKITADQTTLPSLNGATNVTVKVQAGAQLRAGSYMLAITAANGLISRSVYVELSVT